MSAAISALKRRTALLYSRLFDGRLFLIFIYAYWCPTRCQY